jgi:hypothetical protein
MSSYPKPLKLQKQLLLLYIYMYYYNTPNTACRPILNHWNYKNSYYYYIYTCTTYKWKTWRYVYLREPHIERVIISFYFLIKRKCPDNKYFYIYWTFWDYFPTDMACFHFGVQLWFWSLMKSFYCIFQNKSLLKL